MISDLDIWRAAMAIVKRYGDDAMLEAAARAMPDIALSCCCPSGVTKSSAKHGQSALL